MDPDRGRELQRRAIDAFIRVLAAGSPGGQLMERDGVLAAVLPRCPHRSVPNSGIHSGARSLEAALEPLGAAYDAAGVTASVVWGIDDDPEADAVLERFGYRPDAEPAAMSADLAEMPLADLDRLDWDSEASAEEVGRVNDAAYGYPEGEGMAGAVGESSEKLGLRSYRAREDGRVACVLQTIDVDASDCLVAWVATLPEYHGRRLASRLLAAALLEARGRGLATTTLQASMMGRGVYERLGYELTGTLKLWERRPGEHSGEV